MSRMHINGRTCDGVSWPMIRSSFRQETASFHTDTRLSAPEKSCAVRDRPLAGGKRRCRGARLWAPAIALGLPFK